MNDNSQIPLFGDMLKSISDLGGATSGGDVQLAYKSSKDVSLHDVIKGSIIGLLSEDSLTQEQVNLLNILLGSTAAIIKDV